MFDLSETVNRKFVDSVELSDWEIETDSGWQPTTHIHKTAPYQEWILKTETNKQLVCADTHIIFDEKYNQIFTKDCVKNKTKIITKDGPELVTEIVETSSYSNMFDVTVDSEDHRFWSGDILSHNSTILDALTFVLFGKPFRSINKPGLINSINERDCVVEIEFTIGKKSYKIVRGMKPNRFEIYCDDELVNQEAASKDYQEYLEKFILKMSHKSFTQIVVLGSSTFVPFMQLSAFERRAIIEDLLDIQIFSSMNTVVKQKTSQMKDETNDVQHKIEICKLNIESTRKLISEIDSNKLSRIEKIEYDIANNKIQLEELQKQNDLISQEIYGLNDKTKDKDKLNKKSTKLIQLESKLETNASKIKKDIEFFENNDNCPTCRQSIDSTFKDSELSKQKGKLNELSSGLAEIEKQINENNVLLKQINDIVKKIESKNVRFNSNISAMNLIQKMNVSLQKDISALKEVKEEDNTHADNLKRQEETLLDLEKQYQKLVIDKHYYEVVVGLLKDTGIKTKIIRQYLPVMNKLINKYLTGMEFYINFNINENFEEVIKSRYRDVFSYENFSEGEKQKIDLALLFTWRAVAKMKNSVSTNLLILDEIFDSSLDSSATEELLKILNSISIDTNVLVISHKSDVLFDKFRSVIRFEKINNFSRII